MATSLCRKASPAASVRPSPRILGRPSRVRVVRTEAGFGEFVASVADGFVRIFSPSRDVKLKDWENTGNSFKGDIVHHEQARKPFRDGWSAAPRSVRNAAYVATKGMSQPEPEMAGATQEPVSNANQEDGPMSYINEAAQRVLSSNFKGDKTMPEHWEKPDSHTGFKGAQKRPRDGFHSKSY